MNKITIWLSATDDGAGACCIKYFLKIEDAEEDQQSDWAFADEVIQEIETYEGSNIHLLAIKHTKEKDE